MTVYFAETTAIKSLQGLINLEPQYQLHISKLTIPFVFFRTGSSVRL